MYLFNNLDSQPYPWSVDWASMVGGLGVDGRWIGRRWPLDWASMVGGLGVEGLWIGRRWSLDWA